jgi:hypothetical protein
VFAPARSAASARDVAQSSHVPVGPNDSDAVTTCPFTRSSSGRLAAEPLAKRNASSNGCAEAAFTTHST